jgi:hypothetical protein
MSLWTNANQAAAKFLRRMRERDRLYRIGREIKVEHDGHAAVFTVDEICEKWRLDIPAEEFQPIQSGRRYTAHEISAATGVPLSRIEASIEGQTLIAVDDELPPRFTGELIEVWLACECPTALEFDF